MAALLKREREQIYLVLDFAIENTGDMNIYAQDVRLEVIDPNSGELIASQVGLAGLKQLDLEPRKREDSRNISTIISLRTAVALFRF